jgi:hypothetical protein
MRFATIFAVVASALLSTTAALPVQARDGGLESAGSAFGSTLGSITGNLNGNKGNGDGNAAGYDILEPFSLNDSLND